MSTKISIQEHNAATAQKFLQDLFAEYHPRDFAVRFWDGSTWEAETDQPRFTLAINHPDALRRMLRDTSSDLSAGEAYIYDDFDIEGDIYAVFPLADWRHNI